MILKTTLVKVSMVDFAFENFLPLLLNARNGQTHVVLCAKIDQTIQASVLQIKAEFGPRKIHGGSKHGRLQCLLSVLLIIDFPNNHVSSA